MANLISKFMLLDRYTRFSVMIIILFSVIIFALASIYHVSGDACWHISAAKFISEEKKMPLNDGLGRNEPFWTPPLFHLLSALVYSAFGGIAVKFVSPVFAVLTLVFAFLAAKKLFNAKIGFYALVFLAFIPIFMDYSIFSYVESMLTFFIVLSVYFAIKNRIFLSSMAAGLGLLTKYNALFIIPLLVYIAYKNSKSKSELIKKISIIALLPLIIASPWLLRNLVILGNPVWPFLNFIFNGVPENSFTELDVSRLTDANLISAAYLSLFGVPNGDPKTFFFFDIPFLSQLLVVWIAGTLIFLLPLIYAFRIRKTSSAVLLSLWIMLYVVLFLLYVPNVGFSVTRIMLPAIPALAMIWAHGFERILSKNKKIMAAVFILVISGFVFAEFAKIGLGSREWSFYSEDFKWVKSNTGKNAVFMYGGQCAYYNTGRKPLSPESMNIKKADYALINQDFRLDKKAIVSNELLSEIKAEGMLVYKNEKTKTEIYKLTQEIFS